MSWITSCFHVRCHTGAITATAHDAPHEPCVIWFTGLSGAGKPTIALALYQQFLPRSIPAECLDGDAIRGMCPGLGFSRDERDADVARVCHWASQLERRRITAICALISAYRQARGEVRHSWRRIFEIYLPSPSPECERRDPKGLYARVRP